MVMETKFSERELEEIMYGHRADPIIILKNTLRDLIKEHPFLCLAFTLAVGVAIGAAMAGTRRAQ
jgi:hypothetical protein